MTIPSFSEIGRELNVLILKSIALYGRYIFYIAVTSENATGLQIEEFTFPNQIEIVVFNEG